MDKGSGVLEKVHLREKVGRTNHKFFVKAAKLNP